MDYILLIFPIVAILNFKAMGFDLRKEQVEQEEKVDQKQVPSFKWDEKYHRRYSGNKERLIIKFPDGGPDDVAILQQNIPFAYNESEDEVDNCIYSGKLKNESDVSVALNGCPLNYTFEIVLDSSRLKYDMYKVVEGVVTVPKYPIPKNLTNAKDVVESDADINTTDIDTSLGFEVKSLHSRYFPSRMTLRIAIGYDAQWRRRFGKKREKSRIEKIVNIARDLFRWRSLGTTINLVVVGTPRYYSVNLDLDDSDYAMRYAQKAARRNQLDANVYMIMSVHPQKREYDVGEAADVGSICSRYKAKRAAITEWANDNTYTAVTFAHEIGHLLGMRHVFHRDRETGDKVNYPPWEDSNGYSCTNKGGVMDYMDHTTKWTTCSVEDFKKYFNDVVRATGRFCLGRDVAPPRCSDRRSDCDYQIRRGICESSRKRRYCRRSCRLC